MSIVNTLSLESNKQIKINFDKILMEEIYPPMQAYFLSKNS